MANIRGFMDHRALSEEHKRSYHHYGDHKLWETYIRKDIAVKQLDTRYAFTMYIGSVVFEPSPSAIATWYNYIRRHLRAIDV